MGPGEGGWKYRMPTIVEAIHSGMTGNFNYYSRGELERAVNSWTSPYNKPVLKHHSTSSEPLGRVVDARMRKSSLKPGFYCTELLLDIVDPDASQKVNDGRYSTVSVGATVNSAVCSICKNDWAKDYCEHRKGRVYDGKLCYWILEVKEFIEVSFVNCPADPYAQVIRIDSRVRSGSRSMGKEASNISNETDTKIQTPTERGRIAGDDSMQKDDETRDLVGEITDAFQNGGAGKETESNDQTPPESDKEQKEQDVDVQALSQKVEAVEAGLAELTAKLNAAVEQNVELARIAHDEMIEHYGDLALQAGLYDSREEAEKAARDMAVHDLRSEILKLRANLDVTQRKIEKVDCPGGEGNVNERPSKSGKSYTLKDLEETLLKLLSCK